MITKNDLDQGLQDYLASTSNIKADSAKRMRVLNIALDKMAQYNWLFAVKKSSFSFTAGTTEYEIDADMGITDFKEVYWLQDRALYDSRRYSSSEGGIATTWKDMKQYLLCDLDETGTYDFEYFSNHMVFDTDTNVTQERFTVAGTKEAFIGPIELKPLIIQLGYFELLRVAKNIDKAERIEVANDVTALLAKAVEKYGFTPKKGIKRINIKK